MSSPILAWGWQTSKDYEKNSVGFMGWKHEAIYGAIFLAVLALFAFLHKWRDGDYQWIWVAMVFVWLFIAIPVFLIFN
jgi:hypothetical protein